MAAAFGLGSGLARFRELLKRSAREIEPVGRRQRAIAV